MNFLFDNSHFTDMDAAESGCYLITNGLGGYSCLDLAGGTSRNDHAIFMAALKAPNVRYNMITNLLIDILIDGVSHSLSTQRMADGTCMDGSKYIESVSFDSNIFTSTFNIEDVRLELRIVMVHEENTLMLDYHIFNPKLRNIELVLTPLLRFTPKNTPLGAGAVFSIEEQSADGSIFAIDGNNLQVLCASNMDTAALSESSLYSMKWTLDTRDGRNDTGSCVINHQLKKRTSSSDCENIVIYSMCGITDMHSRLQNGIADAFDSAVDNEKTRISDMIQQSRLKSRLGKQLLVSADAYIVNRESTCGKTIIAGYPFFEDWGRDTMIALGGTTLATGRFDDCKSILKTFAKYEKNGLLPNLFPEGDLTPMYNSVDAPLLFINAVYEYIEASGDNEFLLECFTPMKNIMNAYENGTDFHIKCDTDGLIKAGDALEQLTWMDVRVDDFLPTPRHGKPVEINAYWYSALRVMEIFAGRMGEHELVAKYNAMAKHTKESFLDKFYDKKMGCLKDVLNGTYEENQIRCNQVWTLTMPFTMPDSDMAGQILDTIQKKLYTTIGLRTLTMDDPAFCPVYIGDMKKRDRAYHQGTVWTFPLGAYLRGRIRQLSSCTPEKKTVISEHIEKTFDALEDWLYEGCLGQFAEIYDGGCPTISRGCFAQAWSVGEILRASSEWEKLQNID